LEINLTDSHSSEALDLLRAGRIDVALIFRYDETEPESEGVRLHHLVDDPIYLLSSRPSKNLVDLRDSVWIAGCERCRSHLLWLCAQEGFTPRISYTTDDMVVLQSLVAAGMGVTTIPGLALRAHRIKGITATKLPGADRHVYAATYGQPPDPPATAALLSALARSMKAPGIGRS
jgi:DNA-binding transcriptional LysR family regulator